MEFLKSKFRKKMFSVFLGISICLPLPNVVYANTISYKVQGVETRFDKSPEEFSPFTTDGIDLSKEFFIGLDWSNELDFASVERSCMNHIDLYYTPVTYTNKHGFTFRAGELYAMTSAYRWGYTESSSHVIDMGQAQVILGGYSDFTDAQLEQMQKLAAGAEQNIESSSIVDNFAFNDTSDLVDNKEICINSSEGIAKDFMLNDYTYINSNDLAVQDPVISSNSFMNSNESVEKDLPLNGKSAIKDVEPVKADTTINNTVSDDKEPVAKPTMRERIDKILQETGLNVFVDASKAENTIAEEKEKGNTESTIEEEQEDSNTESIISEEQDDSEDIIEEARRVREQLTLLLK